MLRWQQTPDHVFTEIVTAALEVCIDRLADAYGDTDEERVAQFSSDVVGLFTYDELLAQLRRLLEAHQSPELWMPTDYHFLLLYRALQQQIEFHNDSFRDAPCMMRFGNFVVADIDFDWLCDLYFWDIDFLIPANQFAELPSNAKASLGFSDETFGVVQGMKPHPDELDLKLVTGESTEPIKPESYRAGLDYPFLESESYTKLIPGARQVIAVVTHWESAVTEAVESLPDSLQSRISVVDGGRLVNVDGVRIPLNYSIDGGRLDTNDTQWVLEDDFDESASTIRSAAADLLCSELAEHGFCFRRESWVTADGQQFHKEDHYTPEYLKRHPVDE